MSLRESQEFFFNLCATDSVLTGLEHNPQTLLKEYFQSAAEQDYLQQLPTERYGTYRTHISMGLFNGIADGFPVLRSLITQEEWNDLLNGFYQKRLTQSPIARAVYDEFAHYLNNYTGPLLNKLPYLAELAHYENLEQQLYHEPDQTTRPFTPTPFGDPLALEPILNPHLSSHIYEWPVHHICDTHWEPTKLENGPYALIVLRHPDTLEIEFIEGNPLLINFLKKFQEPCSIEQACQELAQEQSIPEEHYPAFLTQALTMLEQGLTAGVILGFHQPN